MLLLFKDMPHPTPRSLSQEQLLGAAETSQFLESSLPFAASVTSSRESR